MGGLRGGEGGWDGGGGREERSRRYKEKSITNPHALLRFACQTIHKTSESPTLFCPGNRERKSIMGRPIRAGEDQGSLQCHEPD